jgi:AcrR family transcriptional regulator
MDATRTLLETRGGGPWTMDEVAAAAGVTRMTAYRHFGSRSELLLATVRHVDVEEDATGRFAMLANAPSAADAVERWVDIWTEYVPRIHRLAQALLAARAQDPAAAEAWADRMAFLRDGCRRIVTRLDREGRLAAGLDVEQAADLMWAVASIQLWDALTVERGWTAEQYRTHIKRLLVGLLVERPR